MQTIDLNGTWKLRYCDPGVGEGATWFGDQDWADDWIAAYVPGSVHVDLIAAGIVEEPLAGCNASECEWMQWKDWWYRCDFHLPETLLEGRNEVLFAGLDTSADVWVNGHHVGSHNNMFVPLTVDISGRVRGGSNSIVVRADAGLRAASSKPTEKYVMSGTSGSDTARMWIRKAQFSFGWDWAPQLVTCGIWRQVEVRSYTKVALRDVSLRTSLPSEDVARVAWSVDVENFGESGRSVDVRISLTGQSGEHVAEVDATVPPGQSTIDGDLQIENPSLWWPSPLGRPHLYECSVAVGDRNGGNVDGTRLSYGLREVELTRESLPEGGESFNIVINGEKVYCKGANWVPADAVIARVSKAKYRELVRLAASANFNMFRVWGGGIYEDPFFYQLCDEFGILVWQDFMYACSYYPDDDEGFLAEARKEAESAVRSLRNHASIVLWCGNNENQWIHQNLQRQGKAAARFYGQRIYDEVLPEACARLDPTRPYWPSSPYGGESLNSTEQGNRHSWEVNILNPDLNDQVNYYKYAEDHGKFISEFGVLAPPDMKSLEKYLSADELYRGSREWNFHNNEFDRGTIDAALEEYWRPANELQLSEFVEFSQLIQAESLKYALEHWRRAKFCTGGALFWMYSDCWGAVGWSVVDYYLRRKPSYYFVRRAFAPILTSIDHDAENLYFWLCNDTLEEARGTLEYGLVDLRSSEVLLKSIDRAAPANASTMVAELRVSDSVADDVGRYVAYSRFSQDGAVVSENRQFLAGFRFNRLCLPRARLAQSQREDFLAVKADSYAWQVRIEAPSGVVPEDSHFDLLPGVERRVRLTGAKDLFKFVRAYPLNS